MGIFELHNTETQVLIPQPSDLEAAFGVAALKALDLGNKRVLDMILKLREDSRKTMEDLAELVHEMSGESNARPVQQSRSLKTSRGKRPSGQKKS